MSDLFTEAQQTAINHCDGPMMVLAGPGSGKTLTITYRTKNLIEEYGINPSNILVITFTRAAANEMNERFQKIMGIDNIRVTFGTFHAVFFKILKYTYNYDAANILREEEKYQIIRQISEENQVDMEDNALDIKEFVSNVISEIGVVKGDMINVEHYYSKSCANDLFRKIYEDYEKILRDKNKIDFDDMMILCYELLSARKDILKLWQDKYRYILIDEFQDINRIQYEIIKMLAKPRNNLFIVGDDDQSIYSFRGARPEIMLNFPKDYPGCKNVLLDKNFRSGTNIVNTALRLIKNNEKRFDKKIIAAGDAGGKIEYFEFANCQEENKYIVEEINRYRQDGVPYSDMAVIFRTNLGPRLLVEKLLEYNIPFHIKDALPNIYEHWIVRDIFTYINIAKGSRRRSDFLQVINRPNRYISRKIFNSEEVTFDDIYYKYQDKEWMVDRISKLEYNLNFLSKLNPYASVMYIRNEIGYDEFLEEYGEKRHISTEELIKVADELAELARQFDSFQDWNEHILEYTEKLRSQSVKKSDEDMLELVTMHGSKGLEYRIVFLIDVNEGVTPHGKALLDEDIEEERRMFYVAVTRAKERLHVYYVKERFNKPVEISRFVGEMAFDFDEFQKGAPIVHKKYGEGVIKDIQSGKMIVYFEKLRKELVFDIKFAVTNKIITLMVQNNEKSDEKM